MTNEDFKKLQEENEQIRREINELVGLNHPQYSPIWVKVGELINNEIELEKECGE